MISRPLKLGFLASGNGSSARAIVDAIRAGTLAGEARLVVSNIRSSPALAWAADLGVPAMCIPTQADPQAADIRLREALEAQDVELVVLSGYLRQLGAATLGRYAGRILNIHPGPLPEFGGHGMYGLRVHQAVVETGRRETAICIHLVDEEYDHGPEIARRTAPVEPGDTAQTLQDRVKHLEPPFFVETLKRLASGDLRLPHP